MAESPDKEVKPRDREKKSDRRKRSKSRSRSREKKRRSRSRDRHHSGSSNNSRRRDRSRSRSRSRRRGGKLTEEKEGGNGNDLSRKEKAPRVVPNPIPAPERRVYVGGLAYDLSEDHIKAPFSAFGQVVMVDMPREPGTNRSKGFCFVEYTTREAAELALRSMNGYTLGGRAIKVGRSTPVGGMSSFGMPPASLLALRAQQMQNQTLSIMRPVAPVVEEPKVEKKSKPDPAVLAAAKAALAKKIYVGQIVETLSTEHIQSIFAPFGTIVSLRLSTAGAKEGQHKGYGFIEFETEESANEAARLMNGFELCGQNLKVNKAIA